MNFGIDTYLSVHYYDHTEESKLRSFLSSVSGLIIINGLLLILLFSVLGYFLFQLIFPEGDINFFPYGFMSVITAFFNGYFRTYVNMQVFGDKPVKYFLLGLFNFCVTVIISLILIYQFPFELTGPMWGRFLSGCLIFLLTLFYGWREFGISFKIPFLSEIRNYATPIVIFSLLTWVLGYINNFILKGLNTSADVGVYNFTLTCTLLIEYAALGLLSTINPRIFKLWKSNPTNESSLEENRYNHVFSAFNIIMIALNILILPYIIRFFIKEDFHASIEFIPIICASFAFKGLYNTLINPIYYFKKTKVLPKILLISAIIQIVSGVILIKYFGIWGAVWSYFLVKPIQLLFIWRESSKVFDFKFNIIKMIIMPTTYCCSVIILSQVTFFSELQSLIIQLFIAVILVLIVYKNEVKGLRRLFTG
jgi:O-antigen/teichoic acid export membrane protein